MLFCQLLHVVFDIFRIGGDHRTVIMVSGPLDLLSFIRNTRIEDEGDIILYKPCNMAVGQLGRIAFGFTGDCFKSQFIYVSV